MFGSVGEGADALAARAGSAVGRGEIARRFEGWFARASDFEVVDTHRDQVGPRNRLSWRFRLSRDGQAREVIEQLAFVDVDPEGICEIGLLVSKARLSRA